MSRTLVLSIPLQCLLLVGLVPAQETNWTQEHAPFDSQSAWISRFDSASQDDAATNSEHVAAYSGAATAVSPAAGVAPCDQYGVACDAYGMGCGTGGCGDLMTRPSLTNGLFGAGYKLADNGILLNLPWTQFYQGVTRGGGERKFRYGNKLDLYMFADTGKLGLWEGGQLQIHAVDWQFGQNAVQDAAGLAPVNTNLLTPLPEESFALTHLLYMQQLPGGWVVQGGRYNALDLWSAFYPDYGRGIDGFMNVSTMLPLSLLPSLPLVSNVAGVLKMSEKGPQAGLVVIESQHSPTTVGMEFPNGVTLLGLARAYSNFGGLPGSHTLMGTYANGQYTSFDTSGWGFVPGNGIVPATKTGTWAATYLGEQRLWIDPCNDKRYTKLFGYVGFSDEENSPFAVTASLSLEAFGALDARPNDRMGVAYFYSGLNNDFQNAFNLLTPVGDVHGGEVYYNAQLTPWFHLTFDLQAVEPATDNRDTAVVLGLRAKLTL